MPHNTLADIAVQVQARAPAHVHTQNCRGSSTLMSTDALLPSDAHAQCLHACLQHSWFGRA
eukprot:4663125-Alexandrium_andersonii.AAC.1